VIELVPNAPAGATLVEAVSACLARHGAPKSVEVIAATVAAAERDDPAAIARGLRGLGLEAAWEPGLPADLPADVLPAVVLCGERAFVLRDRDDERFVVEAPGAGEATAWPVEQARSLVTGLLLIRPAAVRDSRADELVATRREGWFWPTLWRYRRYFGEAVALSAVVNILGLAGIVFMMTVYDRVLPNQAYVTLWSLAAGVAVATVFEFAARTLRGHVLDAAGKKIDLVLGDTVFARVLGTRLEHRSQSSGAFANILKEFESVRSFVTSASLTAVADLPFALLFLVVCGLVAGPLVYVPLAAFLVVTLLSIAVQVPLARAANENLREAAVRHGTVIESLEGIETLKALRAETRMRRRHEAASEAIARSAIKSQALSNLVVNVTLVVQQLGGALLLVWGVYLAGSGDITAGALIAAYQLNSRAIAPLMSVSSLAVRFQQARSAMASLNRVMALPLEREPDRPYFSGGPWAGELELRGAGFAYGADAPVVIDGVSLKIRPGERVAILGRMGSGKSTLLRLLSGLYRPTQGQAFLDGVEQGAIEPADVRAAVALVGQDARLFHGTLAENLRIAAPGADDARLLETAKWTGVAEIAAAHPQGFGLAVGERGDTLSGGQRQAVAIARAVLARPRVLLLDEPTSAMDQRSEQDVVRALIDMPKDTTVVVVTHKQALLALADRVIVLDRGRIVADGPKADVLKALNDGRVRAVA